MTEETSTLDPVDRRIIRCIQLAPRIPFRAAAEIMGVSEQTVARRYRRLVRSGVLRVTAIVNPEALGQSNWMVRARCRPSGAEALGRALAQRDDVSWVTLLAGGSEIICTLRARTSAARDDLLIERLPRSAPVLDIEASMVLRRFVGSGVAGADEWTLLGDMLTADQTRAVRAWAEGGIVDRRRTARVSLTTEDSMLLDALTADGRASFATLGEAARVAETRAARRLRSLFEAGAVFLDVDVSAHALGYDSVATVWLTVAPADLDRVGRAVADLTRVAYAAAITGRQNITASIVCRDTAEIYDCVTTDIGAIPGIGSIEISPVLRHLKQAGALTTGSRLVPPES